MTLFDRHNNKIKAIKDIVVEKTFKSVGHFYLDVTSSVIFLITTEYFSSMSHPEKEFWTTKLRSFDFDLAELKKIKIEDEVKNWAVCGENFYIMVREKKSHSVIKVYDSNLDILQQFGQANILFFMI